jgi:hypothetical protein
MRDGRPGAGARSTTIATAMKQMPNSPACSAPTARRPRAAAARAAAVAAALLGPGAALHGSAQAGNCEALRSGIEARIRAAGAERFTVEVVDGAAAEGRGKVVGRCERGTRLIVYRRGAAAVPMAAPSAAAAAAPAAPGAASAPRQPPRPGAGSVITECKDGSTPADGRCKR